MDNSGSGRGVPSLCGRRCKLHPGIDIDQEGMFGDTSPNGEFGGTAWCPIRIRHCGSRRLATGSSMSPRSGAFATDAPITGLASVPRGSYAHLVGPTPPYSGTGWSPPTTETYATGGRARGRAATLRLRGLCPLESSEGQRFIGPRPRAEPASLILPESEPRLLARSTTRVRACHTELVRLSAPRERHGVPCGRRTCARGDVASSGGILWPWRALRLGGCR